ncbi:MULTISPECIES: carboxymuconolactone decarboxylase family protein [unclassified Caballeronia]|uniref:carboxymuconolactone decarboxylase family protein n=1 Tax=unclassified Caballeronia TaxID=2646786 RepID=UPI001F40634B|nr:MULTISPECIES: carboxymuconolactone decarboxylase family protein [unclassified Caballeronia]MCE4547523.1 carboxymuconolactone decarboxylase family protein [Caballeronia sp. PC1]MCE4574981.1 carboxymuconolactone decarboxylase family protein [Caballeronia sp. CLC5]
MPRLHTIAMSEATGHAAELFQRVTATVGKVPNSYIGIGANSPVALEAVLSLEASLKRCSLSVRDIEVVKLVVSETTGCDYCLAAHTLMSKKIGLTADAIVALRQAKPSGDARSDALASFVSHLMTTSGTVNADTVTAIKLAGLTDTQIVDVTMAIASIAFTNLFNRINNTTLDFPAAD